jgi:tetratricopeptide (TPR) repeat protein
MADLMEGNYEGAIKNFLKGNENNIYFNYFKALALKAAGREEEAKNQFTKIANINFSNWNIAIVRRLANKQLGNT